MKELAQIFKALSDESRLEILGLLLIGGKLCVCDVEGTLGITHSKSSRHLRYLLNAGLVENHRHGVWMHYSVVNSSDSRLKTVLDSMRALISKEQWAVLIDRLETWKEKKKTDAINCSE